jgi:predicted Zn finger-like uncharacterized protein
MTLRRTKTLRMRIACPACSAVYDVPEQLLSGPRPRALRCARCGHSWTPGPAGAAEPAPPAAAPAPGQEVPLPAIEPEVQATELRPPPIRTPRRRSPIEPPLRRPEERRSQRTNVLLVLGWLVSIGVLVGLGWAMVVWRAEVVEAWPPAARLYMALGLEV